MDESRVIDGRSSREYARVLKLGADDCRIILYSRATIPRYFDTGDYRTDLGSTEKRCV